jgi:hypothetical protein
MADCSRERVVFVAAAANMTQTLPNIARSAHAQAFPPLGICSMIELRTLTGDNTSEVGMSTLNGGPLQDAGTSSHALGRRNGLTTAASGT